MKKIIFAVIAVLFALSFVTCDDWTLPFGDDEVVEYTDVEYSQDGSQIKIYIDGTKPIPVTKGQKRAMSRDLALMAYDFFEVIFEAGAGSSTIARATWELGQPAGISGVLRGVDYGTMSGSTPSATLGNACLFVGKTDGKTLLGVGQLTNVDDAATPITSVSAAAHFVLFSVAAIQTGLAIEAEDATAAGVALDSFKYTGGSGYTTRVTHSSRSPLGGVDYPMYSLDPTLNATTIATYGFGFVTNTTVTEANILKAIKIAGTGVNGIEIQKRLPRYMDSGHYLVPKTHIDTKSTVVLNGTAPAVASDFTGSVELLLTAKGTGVFSFYIKIPVYMVRTSNSTTPDFAADDSTNSGPKPVKWFITTGLDSELYSLDDGKSSGGCVLIGVGVSSLEFLEIKWGWITP